MESYTSRSGGGGGGHYTHSREMSHAGPSEPYTPASTSTSTPGTPAALPSIPTDPHYSSSSAAARDQQAAAKQSLKQWWTKFTKQQQQQQAQLQQAQGGGGGSSSTGGGAGTGAGGHGRSRDDTSPTSTSGKGVFGVPLTESLKYAGVAISMVGPDGVNQVYGYIPVVVAKCGLFLKQKATTVEGVFRISGSTRRMKELQDIFDRPPSYGRDVVWGPWSVHDAASVLRRYLNQMPEPVVPYELYDEFRNALPPLDKVKDAAAIHASVLRYKALIACLSSSSKYLLCYVLDLLNVFSRNHEQNLMPAANLAVVFQPGLIRPPHHGAIPIPGATAGSNGDSSAQGTSGMTPPSFPQLSRSSSNPFTAKPSTTASGPGDVTTELQRRQDEIKINQEVLEFLINHQDHFVALPEPLSPAEISPVSPAGNTPSQGQAQALPSKNGPVASTQPTSVNTAQSTSRQAPLSQRAPTQPFQSSGTSTREVASATQPNLMQSSAPQSGAQEARLAQPIQPSRPSVSQSSTQTNQQQHQPHYQPQPQSRSQARPHPQHAAPSVQIAPRTYGNSTNAERQAQANPPFQNSQVETPTGRSSPAHRLGNAESTAGPSSTHRHVPAATVFPVVAAPTQSKKGNAKDAEKDKDRDLKEERKPRKLKKGRTPTTSGTSTPLSPPPLGPSMNPTQTARDYVSISHTASDASVPTYDEDTPLASDGPGVKRSRTLPSPGDNGTSVRSVSGRRQSESRPSPTALAPESKQASTPSPLRSPLPLPASRVAAAAYDDSSSTLRPPPPIRLDGYASDESDAGHSSTARKSPGWRRAFKSKDRDSSNLKAPTAPSMQTSRSADSAPVHGDRGMISPNSGRFDEVAVQQRRPSTASAATKSERSGASGSNATGQLRAVRNPPLQGQSKRDRKGSNADANFSHEAIRDAVANIGR